MNSKVPPIKTQIITLDWSAPMDKGLEEKIKKTIEKVPRILQVGQDAERNWPKELLQGLQLYKYIFRDPDEREDEEVILNRLRNYETIRSKKGCFDIQIGLNKEGNVVSWHQYSTIPLENSESAIMYLQYAGIADRSYMKEFYNFEGSFRQLGIYSYNMILMEQVGNLHCQRLLSRPQGIQGSILETEICGQATTPEEVRYTAKRLTIHEECGAKAILMKSRKNGTWINPHYQPSLSSDRNGKKMLLLYKPSTSKKYDRKSVETIDMNMIQKIMTAYIENFRNEGFNESEINKAQNMFEESILESDEAFLVPPTQTPSILDFLKTDEFMRRIITASEGDIEKYEKHIRMIFTDLGIQR